MSNEEPTGTDDVVYLLAELQSAPQGSVHEIGSRARVLEVDGERLTLAVGSSRGEDVVTCPSSLVAHRRRSFASRRHLRANGPAAA